MTSSSLGIKRALESWQEIDFIDDHDGCLFTARIHRKVIKGPIGTGPGSEKSSEKSSEKILTLLGSHPELTAAAIADRLRISQRAVEKQIAKLREDGRIRRVGPDKGGHWEVMAREGDSASRPGSGSTTQRDRNPQR